MIDIQVSKTRNNVRQSQTKLGRKKSYKSPSQANLEKGQLEKQPT